jgi:hypothetical protein
MGYNTGDRILEQTTTTGTGDITLAGAVTGYRAVSVIATRDGDIFPYVIAGASEWEVGIGTRQSSTTFSRSPTASSNAGALVSFSAGTKEVWIDWTNAHINSLRSPNLVTNGACEVSQERGTTALTSAATGSYIVDQILWQFVSGGTFTIQQVADAPPGLTYSVKMSPTVSDSSIAATDHAGFVAPIEGYDWARMLYGTANAQSGYLNFWVKSQRTGTLTGSITNFTGARGYTYEVSIPSADTWFWKNVFVPGDTSGTWETTTNAGVFLLWAFAVGSNFQQAAGSWATPGGAAPRGTANQTNFLQSTGDAVQITGISFTPGNVPVPQDQSYYLNPKFSDALTQCQRWYEKSFDYATAPVQNAGINLGESTSTVIVAGAVSNQGWFVPFKVRKRLFPNYVGYNTNAANAFVRNLVTGTDATATSVRTGGQTGWNISFTGLAAWAVGNDVALHWVATSRLV